MVTLNGSIGRGRLTVADTGVAQAASSTHRKVVIWVMSMMSSSPSGEVMGLKATTGVWE